MRRRFRAAYAVLALLAVLEFCVAWQLSKPHHHPPAARAPAGVVFAARLRADLVERWRGIAVARRVSCKQTSPGGSTYQCVITADTDAGRVAIEVDANTSLVFVRIR